MRRIVVDSSALISILFREEGHEPIERLLRDPDTLAIIGAPTLLETHIVLSARARRRNSPFILNTLLAGKAHRIVPFDEGMVRMAHAAFEEYGKGQHPAGLNYGDCMTYAVARALDLPLLYKGQDFARTDIRSAL